ncbi:Bax inhibitor-1/YccA family protein [Streptomyces sp. NBC_01310]|uniref:Bax inhibitor-1/YccA family protein n=1 Tax=Streptomyces sp. NBC_01310 TaxID=2903820 RepID=UPI0035B5D6CB|nr:Bax inhibitor-1/YccA family protein [Streptomyces sp. NBC_01310]WSJ63694.1 Bax inhibitor-1/YccA family protein [Streptomyces sp. NBC_01310]
MRSTNPVLSRWKFRHGGAHAPDRAPDRAPVAAHASAHPARAGVSLHKDPAADHRGPHDHIAPHDHPAAGGVMTMDDVVVRTGITLGVVVLAAVLSWILLPVDRAGIGGSYAIAAGAALTAFAAAMTQTFLPRPSPALILTYAAFEGVFLGVFSNTVSTHLSPGVVVQAVLGTMAVFAAVLIAYKLRWIRVTRRFYGFVTAAAMGFVLLMAANLLFSAFTAGPGLGFRSGGLGILFGVLGVILAAAFLSLHFKQIEDGITYGAPRAESWTAAFGLTLTLVWLYVETLNLLTLVTEEDAY